VQHYQQLDLLRWRLSFLAYCGTLDELESNQRGFWSVAHGFFGAQLWVILGELVLILRLSHWRDLATLQPWRIAPGPENPKAMRDQRSCKARSFRKF